MKKVLVTGAGGFIGNHLVNSLKKLGCYVIGADLKYPEYNTTTADEFYITDLRNQIEVSKLITIDIDTIYQLAADMGGAGYIFTGDNDADIMSNSVTINLNIANEMVKKGIKNVLYTSSACVYPAEKQIDNNPHLTEDSSYPANPDSEYGWEKLFSERMWLSYQRNYGLNIRIVRLHNVFGPYGSWNNGKEKSPAALCRKIAMSDGEIEVWGNGNQTRSFLYIDDCIIGIHKILESNYSNPINLGSDRMISINNLALLISKISNKTIKINHIKGPVGVMGRNSDNTLIKSILNWEPPDNLEYGLNETYNWIKNQIK